ncbi:positive regulation of myeloid dendritic cell activation [Mactra antiquata]
MLLPLIIVSTIVGCNAFNCQNGWITYENSCYYVGPDDVHYTEAVHYCSQRNSHLVYVETARENSFLKGRLDTYGTGHSYWLGMTDEMSEGIWQWNSGNSVYYFNWAPTEPQNHNNEDCAVFHKSLNFQWADVPCASGRRPLCENAGYNTGTGTGTGTGTPTEIG